jgi:hypothetical protein
MIYSDQNYAKPYPSITPVSFFRVIFVAYFGANYHLLPDKIYYSPQSNPYDFTEITDQITESCPNQSRP